MGADNPDFESWVEARGAALLRFAYLVAGERTRAEEAVQEALISVWPRWRWILRRGDPEAYVRRSIVNAGTSSWRRFRRREVPVADPVDAPASSATNDPADELADQDAAWSLCASLPVKQRAAVVLRYYEGLSDAEIAAVLGCTAATVRSQIHRALAALRTRLDIQQEQEEVDQP
jgi:RNA polymerase sigma-70 factor (sigma-E family)